MIEYEQNQFIANYSDKLKKKNTDKEISLTKNDIYSLKCLQNMKIGSKLQCKITEMIGNTMFVQIMVENGGSYIEINGLTGVCVFHKF